MTALLMLCASSAMATAPQARAAVPLSDMDGEFSYSTKSNQGNGKKNTKTKHDKKQKGSKKSNYLSTQNLRGKTEIGFYALGGSGIEASNEYAEISYRFAPGFSVGGGMSLSSPADFKFGLINIHSEKKVMGVRPSVQIGYAGFVSEEFNTETFSYEDKKDSGVLCGFRLEYQLNPFASVDMVVRNVSSGVEVGHDVHSMGSFGVRFFL